MLHPQTETGCYPIGNLRCGVSRQAAAGLAQQSQKREWGLLANAPLILEDMAVSVAEAVTAAYLTALRDGQLPGQCLLITIILCPISPRVA